MSKALRLVAVAIVIVTAPNARAHPLGNFTVNRSSVLEISQQDIVVRYAVDVAEVPTFQEFASIDSNKDNVASPAELSTYADVKGAFLVGGVRLVVDGLAVHMTVGTSTAMLQRGQGGLQVLRIDTTFAAPLAHSRATITYRDFNFTSFPGWREVVASGIHGEGIVTSDVPAQSLSNALRAYPAELMSHPPAVTSATMSVAPGASTPVSATPTASVARPPTGLFAKEFAALIERDLTFWSIVVAVLLAMAFGAVHAIGPGHGKTVMAAYLAGGGGKIRHAVGLALAVSLMHTSSVIALGLITWWLTSSFSAAAVYPWLGLASGAVILGLGAWLFRVRWTARAAASHGHVHEHVAPVASPFSWKGLSAIAFSGGLVPSPTAVVVLLGAISLHRVPFGVGLVVAFSVGLAVALSVVGILVLRARTFASVRWGIGTGSIVPSLASAAVFAVGAFLTARAVWTLVN